MSHPAHVPEPKAFSRDWVNAWNRHDVEAVLDHFHDEVLFTSPVAAQLRPDSEGVIRGKAALRDYWTEALRLIPDLSFTVEAVYVGCTSLVINYRNQKGVLVSEVLLFDRGKVREGHGTYPCDMSNPAGTRMPLGNDADASKSSHLR